MGKLMSVARCNSELRLGGGKPQMRNHSHDGKEKGPAMQADVVWKDSPPGPSARYSVEVVFSGSQHSGCPLHACAGC